MSMMLMKTYLKFNVRLRLNNERLVGVGHGWTNACGYMPKTMTPLPRKQTKFLTITIMIAPMTTFHLMGTKISNDDQVYVHILTSVMDGSFKF